MADPPARSGPSPKLNARHRWLSPVSGLRLSKPPPTSTPTPTPSPTPNPSVPRSTAGGANVSTEARLQLREHHRCASEQRTRSRGNAFDSECDREVKNGNAFHRAPASDLVVAALHAAGRGAESLGGVEDHRRRSAPQLIPKVRVERCRDGHARTTSLERNAVEREAWPWATSKASSDVAKDRARSGARTTAD